MRLRTKSVSHDSLVLLFFVINLFLVKACLIRERRNKILCITNTNTIIGGNSFIAQLQVNFTIYIALVTNNFTVVYLARVQFLVNVIVHNTLSNKMHNLQIVSNSCTHLIIQEAFQLIFE